MRDILKPANSVAMEPVAAMASVVKDLKWEEARGHFLGFNSVLHFNFGCNCMGKCTRKTSLVGKTCAFYSELFLNKKMKENNKNDW